MVYIILEIQKSNSGAVGIVTPIPTYTDKAEAEQKFYTGLAAAAVSPVDVHSVVMLDDTGKWLDGKTFYHGS